MRKIAYLLMGLLGSLGLMTAFALPASASTSLVHGPAGKSAAAVSHVSHVIKPDLVRNLAQVLAHPDGISPTTLITPAVAGYYESGFAGDFTSLGSVFTPNADTADATFANGQQLCDNGSGWTAGIGAIENGSTQTVKYGIGQQATLTDGDPCLDGVIPAADQVDLNGNLDAIPATNQLEFAEHTYNVITHTVTGRRHHRVRHTYVTEHVLFQAEDLTTSTNVWSAVASFPLGVHPVLNEPGVGTQQPAVCSTPLPAGTTVAAFSDVLANGRGLAEQTAVQVDALPASADVGELSPASSISPTSGGVASSFDVNTVGALC